MAVCGHCLCERFDDFLGPLGAGAELTELARAIRALLWHDLLGTAVVAADVAAGGERGHFVQDHARGAVVAFEHPAALGAGAAHETSETPLVEQKHGLSTLGECSFERTLECRSDKKLCGRRAVVDVCVGPAFVEHVDDVDLWEFAAADSLGKVPELGAFGLNVGPRFERGCGRAEQDRAAGGVGSDDGDVAGVVAGELVLLVRRVVLLVDDDEPEVLDRCENRRPRADDHAGRAIQDARPRAVALRCGQARVHHRDV